MASIMDDDSILEVQRTSLLDVVEERNKTLNKKSLLHRAVIISKMSHNNFTDIGQFYEKFFKDTANAFQSEVVTGLMLMYRTHCVHVVETCLEILLELFRVLRHEEQQGEGHMECSKILIVSHDISQRLYQQWSFRLIDIEAPGADELDPCEDAPRLVVDMLTQLLKLGAYIARQPKVAMKNAMDSLTQKVPEMMPLQDVVGGLLESDTLCINTPQEYLDQYERPYDVVLRSELVWPMPVGVFPYN